MSCMCGDLSCASCGPAQGSSPSSEAAFLYVYNRLGAWLNNTSVTVSDRDEDSPALFAPAKFADEFDRKLSDGDEGGLARLAEFVLAEITHAAKHAREEALAEAKVAQTAVPPSLDALTAWSSQRDWLYQRAAYILSFWCRDWILWPDNVCKEDVPELTELHFRLTYLDPCSDGSSHLIEVIVPASLLTCGDSELPEAYLKWEEAEHAKLVSFHREWVTRRTATKSLTRRNSVIAKFREETAQ